MSNYAFKAKLASKINMTQLKASLQYSVAYMINIKTNSYSASHSLMPSSVSKTLWFGEMGLIIKILLNTIIRNKNYYISN